MLFIYSSQITTSSASANTAVGRIPKCVLFTKEIIWLGTPYPPGVGITHKANPQYTELVANVANSGFTRRTPIQMPFSSPPPSPMASPIRITMGVASSVFVNRYAMVTLIRLNRLPREISMPPTILHVHTPITTHTMGALDSRNAKNVDFLKNPGFKTPLYANKMASSTIAGREGHFPIFFIFSLMLRLPSTD